MSSEARETASPDSAERAGGLTLEQFAGVTAALAEKLPLDEVLAAEGLGPEAWPAADTAWKARLVGDGGGPGPLFPAYLDKLHAAEDWLARRVGPLDDDPGAWTSFLRAWSAEGASLELLEIHGLGMNDVARLQRRWARRMEEDASLRRKLQELGADKPRPLPAISAEPARFRPFPWSRPGARPPAPSERAPLTQPSPPSRPSFQPSLSETVCALSGAAAFPVLPFGGAAPPSPRPERPPSQPSFRPSLNETVAAVPGAVVLPVLPFGGAVLPSPRPERSPSQPSFRPSLNETACTMPGTAALPVLPFGEAVLLTSRPGPAPAAAKPLSQARIEASVAELRAKVGPSDLNATVWGASSPLATSVLPFGQAPPPESPLSRAAKAPSAAELRATLGPKNLGQTACAPASAAAPSALPFGPRPSPGPQDATLPVAAAQASGAPALPLERHAALHVELDAVYRARVAVDLSRRSAWNAALDAHCAPASPPPPSFSLEQYASLCVEIRRDPTRAGDVLRRYYLSTEQHRRLDAHWRPRLAEDAALRARWEQACATYDAWLQGAAPASPSRG